MRFLVFLTVLAVAGAALGAQTPLLTDSARVFHTQIGAETIARAKNGNLYMVYCRRVATTPSAQFDVFLARSTDGGKTWNLRWQQGFAAKTASEYGNRQPSLAIDSQGNLHVAWWHQVSSQYTRTIRYRRWKAGTGTWDPELTLNTQPNRMYVYSVLAVDSKDYVWFLHSDGSSWRCVLKRSTQPFNAANTFAPVTPALPTSVGNQNPDLVIDALDRVHVSYYSYSPVSVRHIWMDPGAANPQWSQPFDLANTNATADYYTTLGADSLGNVYGVYGQDVQGGKTQNPMWFLRRWDGQTRTWSSPINFYRTTRKQWEPTSGQANDGRVISAAVDENTGELYFIYRDVDKGELVLARWRQGDPQPTPYAKLMNTGSLPPNSRNYFLYPQLRGTLYPRSNLTAWGLDMAYTVGDQNAPNPTYTLYWDTFPAGSILSTATPKIGSTYPLLLQAPREAGQGYLTALTLSGIAPGIAVGRRFIPAVPDTLFFLTVGNVLPTVFVNFAGTLDSTGAATAKVVIPNLPALVGLKVDALFVTFGTGGLGAISNPWRFTITN